MKLYRIEKKDLNENDQQISILEKHTINLETKLLINSQKKNFLINKKNMLEKAESKNKEKLEEIEKKKLEIKEMNREIKLLTSRCKILEIKKSNMTEKLPVKLKQSLEEQNKDYFGLVENKMNKFLQEIVILEGNKVSFLFFNIRQNGNCQRKRKKTEF